MYSNFSLWKCLSCCSSKLCISYVQLHLSCLWEHTDTIDDLTLKTAHELGVAAKLEKFGSSLQNIQKNSVIILLNDFWYIIKLIFLETTDYWFGSSFKALQIQSPSTNRNGNFPEWAKGETLGHNSINHLGRHWAHAAPAQGASSALEMNLLPNGRCVQRNKIQCVGSLHIKAGISTYHFHSRYEADDT